MNPLEQPLEEQSLPSHLAAFKQTIQHLLVEHEIDGESRLEILSLVESLDQVGAEAEAEMATFLAETQKKDAETIARLEAKLERLNAAEEAVPEFVGETEPPPLTAKSLDPDLGQRLGQELLREFGHLHIGPIDHAREFKTMRDWVQESISVAAVAPARGPSQQVISSSSSPTAPTTKGANPTPETLRTVQPYPPVSNAPAATSSHLDIGWSTWLQQSRVSLLTSEDQAKKSANREEEWRDIFQ